MRIQQWGTNPLLPGVAVFQDAIVLKVYLSLRGTIIDFADFVLIRQ